MINKRVRYDFLHVSALAMTLALGAGCGKEDSPTPSPAADMGADMALVDMATADMGADMAVEDMGADQGVEDMGADMAEAGCAFPAPAQGTSAEAVALAADPARCGQPTYRWVEDASLGDVKQIVGKKSFSAALLKGLAEQGGVALPSEPKHDVKVSRIEYTTQDRGSLINASALIASPVTRPGDEGSYDILLLLHGTSGFTDQCAPSGDADAQLLAAAIASLGYIVVGPDYTGLKGVGDPTGFLHPYLVGEAAAMSSLDAARAAGKLDASERGGSCAAPRLLVLGGSQGGHAALWVDRLAPYYAPELTLMGTVATVPPADMLGQIDRALQEVVQASANALAFYGASAHWYGAQGRLGEVFKAPYDVDIPKALGESCDPSDALGVDLRDISSLDEVFNPTFLEARAQLPDDPLWGCMVVENGLTTTGVKRLGESSSYADSYGIFWVLGEDDQLVHTPIERASFQTLCDAQQMPMRFLECAGASHTRATVWALPEILTFLKERQEGTPWDAATACMVSAPTRCQGTPEDR